MYQQQHVFDLLVTHGTLLRMTVCHIPHISQEINDTIAEYIFLLQVQQWSLCVEYSENLWDWIQLGIYESSSLFTLSFLFHGKVAPHVEVAKGLRGDCLWSWIYEQINRYQVVPSCMNPFNIFMLIVILCTSLCCFCGQNLQWIRVVIIIFPVKEWEILTWMLKSWRLHPNTNIFMQTGN